jgi:secondary thiamine-phosphate synthase enzyme
MTGGGRGEGGVKPHRRTRGDCALGESEACSPARAEIDALAGATVTEFGANWCGICAGAQPAIVASFAAHPAVRHLKIEDGPGCPLGRSFRVRLWRRWCSCATALKSRASCGLPMPGRSKQMASPRWPDVTIMQQAITHVAVDERGSGLVEFTSQVRAFVDQQSIRTGLLTVFCRHTSASLLIQENADPSVRRDLECYFATLAPEDSTRYEHDTEGLDDMPAHLRTALTQVQLSILVEHGRMVLGTWQEIHLFEHRRAAHRRDIVLHLIGE